MTPEARTVRMLPEWASLNRLVLDLFRMYGPAFAVKRLGTGLDLDPVLPLTWADRAQLAYSLGGLLSHAVKHSRHGGLIVCRTAADGDWVKLTIGDNGPWVSAEEASALFLAGPGRGNGDDRGGLYSSRAIIAAHGGHIGLDTSYDSGMWFVVRLPAIAQQNARLSEELEQSKRGRSDLVATLSYELRTPLHVIMGYTDLLLEGAFGMLNAEQLDTVRRIDQGSRDLLGLIDGAIDLGSREPPAERFDRGRHHLPGMIRGFCQLATELLGCDASHLWAWQPSGDVYVPIAGHGDDSAQEMWMRGARIPGPQVTRLLARRDRAEDAPAILVHPRDLFSAGTGQHGMRRCLLLPVRRNGELLGLLTASYGGLRPFTEEQARLASGIAGLAALELENAHLVDELDQVERLKAEFVATMSHQFRIPLNIIIGYNDLLLEGEFGALAPEQAGVLRSMRKGGMELLDVIKRTLDLTREAR